MLSRGTTERARRNQQGQGQSSSVGIGSADGVAKPMEGEEEFGPAAGWTMTTRQRRRASNRVDGHHRSPCGETFRSRREVERFLRRSNEPMETESRGAGADAESSAGEVASGTAASGNARKAATADGRKKSSTGSSTPPSHHLAPQIQCAIAANQNLRTKFQTDGTPGRPIRPDESWTVVEGKLLDAGWTKIPGKGLIDYYLVLPEGRAPREGGTEGVDYLTSELELKRFAVEHLGWGGDEEVLQVQVQADAELAGLKTRLDEKVGRPSRRAGGGNRQGSQAGRGVIVGSSEGGQEKAMGTASTSSAAEDASTSTSGSGTRKKARRMNGGKGTADVRAKVAKKTREKTSLAIAGAANSKAVTARRGTSAGKRSIDNDEIDDDRMEAIERHMHVGDGNYVFLVRWSSGRPQWANWKLLEEDVNEDYDVRELMTEYLRSSKLSRLDRFAWAEENRDGASNNTATTPTPATTTTTTPTMTIAPKPNAGNRVCHAPSSRGPKEERTCPRCDKVFSVKSGLEYHLEHKVCQRQAAAAADAAEKKRKKQEQREEKQKQRRVMMQRRMAAASASRKRKYAQKAFAGGRSNAIANEDASEPTQKRGRGRPPKSSSPSAVNTHDVLYAKGAAAQTMTHPGNLQFYAMCEERYEEWAAHPDGHPSKAQICGEIVEAIFAKGGNFHSCRGGTMKRSDAVEKTKNRMRQIAIPKVRPKQGFGENDVVFARGAANHLYPGNARWRALLDGHVLSYWRDGWENQAPRERPAYQEEIVEETIRIIHSRGGKFRDQCLHELDYWDAVQKTHTRFKDLKRELRDGKIFVSNVVEEEGSASSAVRGEEKAGDSNIATASLELTTITGTRALSRTGCTSARITVSGANALKRFRKPTKKKWRNPNWRSPGSSRKTSRGRGKTKKDDDDDEDSFHSAMLGSDRSDNEDSYSDRSDSEDSFDEEDAVDDRWKDMVPQRVDKGQQDVDRVERLKRRKSGVAQTRPKTRGEKKPTKSKRRAKPVEEDEESRTPSPDYELSEYEMLRLEKIKRNQERLVELGLAGRGGLASKQGISPF